METLTIHSIVTADGILKIEVPCHLPPGPVEVEVTVRSSAPSTPTSWPDWSKLYGLGKEVWQGIDAQQYVRDLREDREPSP
jgi:hypothetical protein